MRSEAAETERTAAPVGFSAGTVRHSERRFTIRPSVPADQDEVADLIRIRAGWLRERSLNHSPWEANAGALAAQCGDADRAVWVLMEGDRIVGRTAWNTNSPESLFTADERRLPALFMHGTVGHPDVRGAGLLMLLAPSCVLMRTSAKPGSKPGSTSGCKPQRAGMGATCSPQRWPGGWWAPCS